MKGEIGIVIAGFFSIDLEIDYLYDGVPTIDGSDLKRHSLEVLTSSGDKLSAHGSWLFVVGC